jgi:hypothetical protein
MTTLGIYSTQPAEEVARLALYDHVFVGDGRTGYVVGFYRRENASVHVLFASGDVDAFPHSEVVRLS